MFQIGSSYPVIHHSPWNGVRLADFVMPFFDFMVGVSLAISLKRVQQVSASGGGFRRAAFVKATVRFVKIFVIGVVTQGGISLIEFNLEKIRIMGILQRVAVCYYAVALLEIFLPRATQFDPATSTGGLLQQARLLVCRYRWQWAAAVVLMAINTAVMYGVDVTAADGTHCGRGVLTPMCSAASYADRLVLGVDHMCGSPSLALPCRVRVRVTRTRT
jgi:predicted acyltransferase